MISCLSAARPKIADYPFTTLQPNLGVVQAGDHTFVLADVPGLIEGAHEGHGLGTQFLRHIERTRLLVHMVDVSEFSGRDPGQDFEIIQAELAKFNYDLLRKPMLLVATKIDVCQDRSRIETIKRKAAEYHLPFYAISSASGEGLDELRFAMSTQLFPVREHVEVPVGS